MSASTSLEESSTEKVRKRRARKKMDEDVETQDSESENSDQEQSEFVTNLEDESDGDLELDKDDGEDITYTYDWPPLVCCFGAAQHAFVPTGRPANRLLNYEIHDRMREAYWEPEKFMRAPGGSAGGVAVALASLGGKVAFMGKLGDDEFGQAMLYFLNVNNVQTRSVRMDSKRSTAVSQMKIARRGRLRMTCSKSCAEDSLLKSELNIDVLKQVMGWEEITSPTPNALCLLFFVLLVVVISSCCESVNYSVISLKMIYVFGFLNGPDLCKTDAMKNSTAVSIIMHMNRVIRY